MTVTRNGEGEGQRLLGSFSMRFAHGLLIVRDEDSTATHDLWDPAESGISVEPDSIRLAVRNAVDGIVTVNLLEGGRPDPALAPLYSGPLNVPTGRLIAHDPNDDIVAVFHVRPGVGQVGIEVDEEVHASLVNVRLSPD